MRKMLIALLALPLAQTAVSAQTAGDAAAGKAYWDRLAPRLTDCKHSKLLIINPAPLSNISARAVSPTRRRLRILNLRQP